MIDAGNDLEENRVTLIMTPVVLNCAHIYIITYVDCVSVKVH